MSEQHGRFRGGSRVQGSGHGGTWLDTCEDLGWVSSTEVSIGDRSIIGSFPPAQPSSPPVPSLRLLLLSFLRI